MQYTKNNARRKAERYNLKYFGENLGERVVKIALFLKSQRSVKALKVAYLLASSTATAQATVAPTIGLLPMPMSPIIST